ncbi:hypothetical protein P261_01128 [Lachnospiraceae bacterium TWA4]|nr:hypothetical protein P261_01128 [Lachnospiraceae bacterium TWA4]
MVANYNDGYEYKGFSAVDTGNSFDWISSYIICEPLNTCNYDGIIECPKVVKTGKEPLFITFTLAGKTYRYDVR